jgi:hypothetical protein
MAMAITVPHYTDGVRGAAPPYRHHGRHSRRFDLRQSLPLEHLVDEARLLSVPSRGGEPSLSVTSRGPLARARRQRRSR